MSTAWTITGRHHESGDVVVEVEPIITTIATGRTLEVHRVVEAPEYGPDLVMVIGVQVLKDGTVGRRGLRPLVKVSTLPQNVQDAFRGAATLISEIVDHVDTHLIAATLHHGEHGKTSMVLTHPDVLGMIVVLTGHGKSLPIHGNDLTVTLIRRGVEHVICTGMVDADDVADQIVRTFNLARTMGDMGLDDTARVRIYATAERHTTESLASGLPDASGWVGDVPSPDIWESQNDVEPLFIADAWTSLLTDDTVQDDFLRTVEDLGVYENVDLRGSTLAGTEAIPLDLTTDETFTYSLHGSVKFHTSPGGWTVADLDLVALVDAL